MGSTKLLIFFIGAVGLHVVAAVDHRVGGDFGWNLPPNPTFFSKWASNRTFTVGDTLRFNSRVSETHNFAMVDSEADLDGCVKPGIVLDTTLFITFDRPGRKYFMCTVGNHCNLGMKFAIDVSPRPGKTPPNDDAAHKVAALLPTLLFITTIVSNFLFGISIG